ncbi:hypothetical protein [Thioclava kandeliae]|uniref:Uncharacterized protein n=1 Tax=Thioclava kandeliae TaxID=3070818 RepID=A0ABV1SGE8_9RHOB
MKEEKLSFTVKDDGTVELATPIIELPASSCPARIKALETEVALLRAELTSLRTSVQMRISSVVSEMHADLPDIIRKIQSNPVRR